MRARGRLITCVKCPSLGQSRYSSVLLVWLTLLALLTVTIASACGGGHGRTLRVFAASSLDEVLPTVVERFEARQHGVAVESIFGGSQLLATQVQEGASVDVILVANRSQAERIDAAGFAVQLFSFATNTLVAVVVADSPLFYYEELAAPGLRIAIGANDVPVGALTSTALALIDPAVARGIRDNVVTEDPNVRIVRSRIELGEVDAAFIYETDAVRVRGPNGLKLRVLPLPGAVPLNEYIAVLLGQAGADADAAAFLTFLASEEVQALLRTASFRSPSSSPVATVIPVGS